MRYGTYTVSIAALAMSAIANMPILWEGGEYGKNHKPRRFKRNQRKGL